MACRIAGRTTRPRNSALNAMLPCLPHLASALILCGVVLGESANADTSSRSVREWPYPFGGMISFVSDVDMQRPWHGAAIHGLINVDLGLPISDSLWVQGSGVTQGASALFDPASRLNNISSGHDDYPTHALLIRRWHRGDIDHLHSWHDDGVFQVRHLFEPSVTLRNLTHVTVNPPPESARAFPYNHLRLVFKGSLPADLQVVIGDRSGKLWRESLAHAWRTHQNDMEVVEFVLPPELSKRGRDKSAFQLFDLASVKLVSQSCNDGCEAVLIRLELDNFSRQTVVSQLPWLEFWSMRPYLYTSHGGFTLVQDYFSNGQSLVVPNATVTDPRILTTLVGHAGNVGSYAFINDLLRQIGVEQEWPFVGKGRDHLWKEAPPPMQSEFDGLYALTRAKSPSYRVDSRNNFIADVLEEEPLLEAYDVGQFFCQNNCGADQGVMLGLNIASGLARLDAGKEVNHLWYTHFATGGEPVRQPTIEQPLTGTSVDWLRRLADRYYNFSLAWPHNNRVWVVPAGTGARYRVVREAIKSHVAIKGNSIRIKSWTDQVTGKVTPAPMAGTRDLHGLTFYVDDAMEATVSLDDNLTQSFTRNRPDKSGRPSITLVDNSAPTRIIGRVSLRARGAVTERNARYSQQKQTAHLRLIAEAPGTASLIFKPLQLDLWNTTHLSFAYRKSGSGRFFLELTMEDGRKIGIRESAVNEVPAGADSGWTVPIAAPEKKVFSVLATTDLNWNSKQNIPHEPGVRPPLPIGRVKAIRIGLTGAKRDEVLELYNVTALRPNGTGQSKRHGALLAGRVSFLNKPIEGTAILVDLENGDHRTTVTDRFGFYYLGGVRPGQVIKVAAVGSGGRRCPPKAGLALELLKPEAEVDIDIADCSGTDRLTVRR